MSNCQYMDLITNSNFRAFFYNRQHRKQQQCLRNILFDRTDRIVSYIFILVVLSKQNYLALDQIVIDDRSGPRYCDEKCRLRSAEQVFHSLRRYFMFTFCFRGAFRSKSCSVRAHYYPRITLLRKFRRSGMARGKTLSTAP